MFKNRIERIAQRCEVGTKLDYSMDGIEGEMVGYVMNSLKTLKKGSIGLTKDDIITVLKDLNGKLGKSVLNSMRLRKETRDSEKDRNKKITISCFLELYYEVLGWVENEYATKETEERVRYHIISEGISILNKVVNACRFRKQNLGKLDETLMMLLTLARTAQQALKDETDEHKWYGISEKNLLNDCLGLLILLIRQHEGYLSGDHIQIIKDILNNVRENSVSKMIEFVYGIFLDHSDSNIFKELKGTKIILEEEKLFTIEAVLAKSTVFIKHLFKCLKHFIELISDITSAESEEQFVEKLKVSVF